MKSIDELVEVFRAAKAKDERDWVPRCGRLLDGTAVGVQAVYDAVLADTGAPEPGAGGE